MSFVPFGEHGAQLHVLIYNLGLTAYEIGQKIFFKLRITES